ncbi:MAG: apolipoprotein N-acyltransferase, partial [Gammaproteobacteria bacterium]|nr:apolipoprotein N-acyltransferase [Gammaproteobacteria bacterium]
SIAPHQHMQIARARAIETGRYLLRATNTGVSAVIAPDGRIEQTIPQFETQVLTAAVRPHTGATPYVVVGDTAIVLLASLAFVLALARKR